MAINTQARKVVQQSPIRPLNTLAVLAFVAALASALAGVGLAAVSISSRPVQEAEVGGLYVRLESTEWLVDQMHESEGQVYSMPANMMPDMPDAGLLRLNVELNLYNRGQRPQHFRADEFELRSAEGTVWSPVADRLTDFTLEPGQALNAVLDFDVLAGEPGLRLVWARTGADVAMPVPEPDPELVTGAQEHAH